MMKKKISVREKKRDSDLEFIIHVLKMLVNLTLFTLTKKSLNTKEKKSYIKTS